MSAKLDIEALKKLCERYERTWDEYNRTSMRDAAREFDYASTDLAAAAHTALPELLRKVEEQERQAKWVYEELMPLVPNASTLQFAVRLIQRRLCEQEAKLAELRAILGDRVHKYSSRSLMGPGIDSKLRALLGLEDKGEG